MTAIESTPDFDALRQRVRATQHARSVPLLVVGALLVNYSVVSFASQPVAWRYGAPLAFVLVWTLGKVNESNVGVGPARGDYLIAAAVVFIATNLLLLPTSLREGARIHELFGAWVVIVGLALAALSLPQRDQVLLAAGIAVVAAGAVIAVFGPTDAFFPISGADSITRAWTLWLLSLVGAGLGLTGLGLYRRERALA
ncbi:MAG TPA: hypothetical protein VFJ17_14710 [Mycobacteriales bacterium]|jgi:hypothetical protein|nr:hypothetical protein [Mycobacteriales bacterium]